MVTEPFPENPTAASGDMDSAEFEDIDIERLVARRSLKWARHGPDVLGAWIAEMDFPLAPPIQESLHEAVERGATGYPLRDVRTGLPGACARWLADTFNWSVPKERIFLIPDVLTGIRLGIAHYSRPDSPVVLPTPAYPPLAEIIRSCRRRVVEIPSIVRSGHAELDLPAIAEALARGAGTVLLCNPHNPLGRVYTKPELTALSRTVAAHDALVIADEVHAPLTYPGHRHLPYASVCSAAADHCITVLSASKGWNIAGLKCAQIILAGPEHVSRWREIPFHLRHGASTFGIVANHAAYSRGQDWLHRLLRHLDGNRGFLANALREDIPQLDVHAPEATYLAWVDCRRLGIAEPAEFFREHANVALSDGSFFGSAGQGFVRLNFATSRWMLKRIITALATAARTVEPVRTSR